MSKTAKPKVHARDHEHGGADPTRIHYEDVPGEGGGGTGILVFKHEIFVASSVSIAAGASVDLPIGASAGPDTLVAFDNATHVHFLEQGTYAINATFRGGALTPGRRFLAQISCVDLQEVQAVSATGTTACSAGRTIVENVPANWPLHFAIVNNDTATRTFALALLSIHQWVSY